MRVLIIGGGASGLLAGALLNEQNISYDLYEKNKIFASKVLASGNGRCNISNINIVDEAYHNRNYFNIKNNFLVYFKSKGLLTYADNEGRIYPYSNSSKSIRNLLVDLNNKESLHLNVNVDNIKVIDKKYYFNNKIYDYMIIAIGSPANIIKNKQSGFTNLLDNLKINYKPFLPSLVGFKIKQNYKLLSGLRQKGTLSLYYNDKLIHKEDGEVNFKDDGISGIVVMNMSFYYNFKKGYKLIFSLNLDDININNYKYCLNPLLVNYIDINNIKNIKQFINNIYFTILDTYPLEQAQVAKGGVDISDINKNFKVKDKPIYIIGEVLDVDGLCGGYNLNFAFNSAYTAVNDLLEQIK